MLVKRMWVWQRDGDGFFKNSNQYRHLLYFEGWFLFGIIPLIIRQTEFPKR